MLKKIWDATGNPKLLVASIVGFTTGFGFYAATDIFTFLSGYFAGTASIGALAFWLDCKEDDRNEKVHDIH